MKKSIILCNKQWQVCKILEHQIDDQITLGSFLQLESIIAYNKQELAFLYVPSLKKKLPVIVHTYPKNYLLFLIDIEKETLSFFKDYFHTLQFVEPSLNDLYQDEYYQIQQMNNQLLNTKRALLKSNQQMKKLLEDIRQANQTINILKRDHLTNLYCCQAFYQNVKKELDDFQDTYDILILKIEHFKTINEIFGKNIGNKLLKEYALSLLGIDLKEKVLIGREATRFYFFVRHDLQFHEILYKHAKKYFSNYPLPISISFKIGVYTIEDDSIAVEQMCSKARLALEEVKGHQRKNIAFYNKSLHEHLILMHTVPYAIKNKEFQLYLQPKVNLKTKEIIGFEALVRWISPKYGLIPPNQFIPFLEKENKIYELDRYIWQEACQILKKRKELHLKQVPISINVAQNDLYEKDLVEVFINLVKQFDIDPTLLHLEILERAYKHDIDHVSSIVSKLQENHFYIEMDDFGTGDSSLSTLSKMPIDLLKLDREFLINDIESKKHIKVVEFIIHLARELDIEVLGEGIETKQQEEFLLSLGCHLGQVYYYCKPQPASYFLK